MRILTVDNLSYNLDKLPETVSEDMAFSVLDNSNPKEPDFFFIPLIYIESFSAPAIVLDIGGKEITMPLDWSIAVGDKEDSNTVEVVPLTSIADRGFSAFIFNPLSSFKADFEEVNVVNFYNEVKQETSKITWPTKSETTTTTIMVFIFVFIASVFFLLVDKLVSFIVEFFLVG